MNRKFRLAGYLAAVAVSAEWLRIADEGAAGNYKLTVTPREDGHGRKFDASRAAELSIGVQP